MSASLIPALVQACTRLGLVFAVLGGASAQEHSGVPIGFVKIGESREVLSDRIVVHPLLRRMNRDELCADLQATEQRIASDRKAINAWRLAYLPQLHGQFEEWEQLTREARQELFVTAANAALSLVLEGEKIRALDKNLLLKQDVEEIDKEILRPELADAMKSEEHQRLLRQLRSARSVKDTICAVDELREIAMRTSEFAARPDARTALLQAAMGIAYVVTEHDPRLRVALSSGECLAALAYGGAVLKVGNEQVSQLLSVADQELSAVGGLTSTYRIHVDRRTKLQELMKAAE